MAKFTTNLTVTTPKATNSAVLSGDYEDIFAINQELDNGNTLYSILSNDTAIGELTLSDCKTLMIKNSGAVGAELNFLINGWTDATPDVDASASYVSILLGAGDFMMLPNLRMLSPAGSNSAGDAYTLDNIPPHADMYVAVNNFAAGSAQLTNEALDNSEVDVDVDDGGYFLVGDLIRIEDEIMEVTSISTDTLTVVRGVHGSTKVAHNVDTAIRYPFFNGHDDFDKYSTPQTDSSGRFKAENFFGYGRTADEEAAGIVAGSVAGKFYVAGYQELGMSGITSSTESGLVASTVYGFDITVDGGGLVDSNSLQFTTSSNTKFGGSDGVIRKIQDVFDSLYYTAGNLLNERVAVVIVNGDIRFTSGQHLSTSSILLATPSQGETSPFGVGRISAIGDIEQAVPAKLPSDTIQNNKTGISRPNVGAFFYDDGYGNILGACSGTINYKSGAIVLNGCPPNANFVVSGNYGSAHAGGNKFAAAYANSIMQIQARSTNVKINTTIELMAIK